MKTDKKMMKTTGFKNFPYRELDEKLKEGNGKGVYVEHRTGSTYYVQAYNAYNTGTGIRGYRAIMTESRYGEPIMNSDYKKVEVV